MVDHSFGTMRLPGECDAIAPDGSCVRVLLRLARGSMAHFELCGKPVVLVHARCELLTRAVSRARPGRTGGAAGSMGC